MFTKEDFEKFAEGIVNEYLTSKTSMNQSILKVAEDHDFNPEQVKRLVEAANVKTFLKLFNQPENKEQNIEFDVADAGEILKSFYKPKGQSISITKVTVSKGSDMNDPLEFFGDFPVKTAEVSDDEFGHYQEPVAEGKKPSRDVLVHRLQKIAEEFTNKIYEQEHEYIEKLEKVAGEFRKLYGPDYSDFEKVALCQYGDEILPVLNDVRELVGWSEPYDSEIVKTASLVIEETPELKLLEGMYQDKLAQAKYAKAVRLINDKLKSVK